MITEIYEINSKTCALIPKNENSAKVIDGKKIITIPFAVQEILDYSCEYYGSSFKGRLQGAKNILGMKYKLPIIIEESKDLVFFPTGSLYNDNCIWLSLNNIVSYERKGNYTKINFTNGYTKLINITYESLENQIFRATKLLLISKNRKKG